MKILGELSTGGGGAHKADAAGNPGGGGAVDPTQQQQVNLGGFGVPSVPSAGGDGLWGSGNGGMGGFN